MEIKLKTAQRFCEEINSLDCGYVADVMDVNDQHHPDYPVAMQIRHAKSGNEIAYAGESSEAQYIVNNIKSRFTKVPD